MKYLLRSTAALLTAALALSGCGGGDTQVATPSPSPATSPSVPSPAASPPIPLPNPPSPTATPTPSPSPTPSPTAEGKQVYREPSGAFEIALPQGYTYQRTPSGITFTSAQRQFGGSVDFGSAQGKQLSTQQLEAALKQEYENRLDDVSWQNSQIQPDGSIRLDWVGRDTGGNDLDAVSFVEQRGDTIYILNLFGINKPYNEFNADAEAIVSGYRVRQ